MLSQLSAMVDVWGRGRICDVDGDCSAIGVWEWNCKTCKHNKQCQICHGKGYIAMKVVDIKVDGCEIEYYWRLV